jgi:hypothetical protein
MHKPITVRLPVGSGSGAAPIIPSYNSEVYLKVTIIRSARLVRMFPSDNVGLTGSFRASGTNMFRFCEEIGHRQINGMSLNECPRCISNYCSG